MKKIIFPSMLLIFVLTSCNLFGPSAKDILTKYLNSYYKGNYSETYALLSAKDKNFKDQKKYEAEFSENPFSKLFVGKISFNVKEVKINCNNAEATVEITGPDLSKAAADLMGIAFASAFGGKKDDKAMENMVAEKLKDKSLPMTTTTQTYDLVKDNEGWRVFLNWEGQKKAEEISEQATQLEKSKKFEEAKAKYQEALSLDKNNKTAQGKLAEIDKAIKAYKAKKSYFDKIEVKNIHLGTDFLGAVGVFGEIKNNGDKTLKQVEVTAYCLDKNDKVVFEKTYNPVLVSEYSFMTDNTPLKPNYSRRFGYELNDAPSDWSKKVTVAVTDVEFQ
ncbi:FxLYD domain-containing protein [bacterium]|nr:FxLYD domain-containing protein [bacterium]